MQTIGSQRVVGQRRSPRDWSADETCFGGALHQKPVGDKDGAFKRAGLKSFALAQKSYATPPASAREGSGYPLIG